MPDNIKQINDRMTLEEFIRAERANRDKLEYLKLAMESRQLVRGARKETRASAGDKAWDQLFKTVDGLRQEWGRGYNQDWITSTYAILTILEELQVALRESKPLYALLEVALDPLCDIAVQYYNNHTYSSSPEKALPKLLINAEFTDDNELTMDKLGDMKRTDGQPMFPPQADPTVQQVQNILKTKLEHQLKFGVMGWLGDLGYEPDGDNRFRDKANKTPLTKEMFENLRDSKDPKKSFESFLKNEFHMDFQLAPKSGPSPSP
jgi:hypothetical protein